MKILPVVFISAAAAIFLAGCGTPVMIKSDPASAGVYRKGAQVGTTP
jgi:hypothetical protein